MAIKPNKLLKISQTIISGLATWDEAEDGDIFVGYPYKWEIKLDVELVTHSSPSSLTPYQYDGMDIKIGDWFTTIEGGMAVRIYEIVSQTPETVIVRAEDVERYNLMLDASFSGIGVGPDGPGYLFELNDDGMPILGPSAAYYMGITLQTDLQSRFAYRNYSKKYISVHQAEHGFVEGDIILMDDDGFYKKVIADQANKDKLSRIVGSVTSINIPGVEYFTFKPRGEIQTNITPELPADILPGNFAYIDPANPGKLTGVKPTRFAVPVYIRLGDAKTGIFLSGGTGSGSSGPLGYNATSYVLADIPARDALDKESLELGDFAFITNNGNGKWEQYELTAKETVEVEIPPVEEGGEPTIEEQINLTWTLLTSQALVEADKSRIAADAGQTSVETQLADNADKVVMIAKGKQLVDVESNDLAVSGEKIVLTHNAKEVQVVAKDTAGTDDVDMRFVPQNGGHVFFGVVGDGVLESELSFDLHVKGGNNDAANSPGSLTLSGGNATSGDLDGGSVVIKAGEGFGTGIPGEVSVQDVYGTKIVDFKTSGEDSSNWLEITNGTADPDTVINGIKIEVAGESSAANVDIYAGPKGNGLVRVGNYSAYSTGLNGNGTNDALVTKGYVLALAGLGEDGEEQVIVAGPGLTEDNGTFSVNVGADTIGLDTVGNVIIKSNDVAGQLLTSTGVPGEEAVWGGINLSNSNAFTGVLSPANGGVGYTSFSQGDLLIGNAGGLLDKMAIGPAGQFLMSTGTGLTYTFNTALYDENGTLSVSTKAAVEPVNNLFVGNSASGVPVVVGVEGEDENIALRLSPKGTGIIVAPDNYTASIGTNPDTIVTKKYVDDVITAQPEPYMRKVDLTANWESEMMIGTVTPSVPNKEVYVYRVVLNTKSAIVGGGVTQARIMAGDDIAMELYENDVLVPGIYIADLPETFTSSNTQLVIQFFQSDSTTPATPTGGDIEVSVFYRIR